MTEEEREEYKGTFLNLNMFIDKLEEEKEAAISMGKAGG